jgi:chromosome segregation ATPase
VKRASAALLPLLLAACASGDRRAEVSQPAPAPSAQLAQLRAMSEPALAAEAARETNSSEVREMASFLHSLAGERRRLRESAAAAEKSLREERKALETQKQRAEALQERLAQLQQKLDALSEIEKSLSERQAKGR